MDFNFVTARLATGAGINSPEDLQVLSNAGITHVINCRDDHDAAPLFAAHPELLYLWNPTPDDGRPKAAEWFGRSLTLAMYAFVTPKAKVYVHCAAGINRGPSTAYAVLRALGLSMADAEALIRRARPQVGLAYKQDADLAVKVLCYE